MESMVRPTPLRLPRLTPDHVFRWSELGLRVDDSLRECIDVSGTLDDAVASLCETGTRVPTDAELLELARFTAGCDRRDVSWARACLEEANTCASRAAVVALLGVWLMKHADVPIHREA